MCAWMSRHALVVAVCLSLLQAAACLVLLQHHGAATPNPHGRETRKLQPRAAGRIMVDNIQDLEPHPPHPPKLKLHSLHPLDPEPRDEGEDPVSLEVARLRHVLEDQVEAGRLAKKWRKNGRRMTENKVSFAKKKNEIETKENVVDENSEGNRREEWEGRKQKEASEETEVKEKERILPPHLHHDLETTTKSTILDLAPLYLPDPATANANCRRDLLELYAAMVNLPHFLQNGSFWPILLVDAWGKYADGMLSGERNLLGAFTQCLNVKAKDLKNGSFAGQYCWLAYGPTAKESHKEQHMGVWEDGINPHVGLRTPIVSTIVPGGLALLQSYATCIPDSCTPQELRVSVNEVLASEGYKLTEVHCQVKDQVHLLEPQEIFGIVFLSVLAVVLVVATMVDVWAQWRNQPLHSGPTKYLLVFSVSHNLQKLFHLDTTRNPQVISCIHGIRFLSICWVVLGHQYAYSVNLSSNLYQLPELTHPIAAQLIENGDLSVDTFFLLSGLLVGLAMLKEVQRSGRFNPVLYIFHRIIRLLPPIAMCDLFMATVSGLLVSGPLAGLYRDFYLYGCRNSWWLDVSFMSNLIYPKQYDKDGASTCLPHCWYTATDAQLYLAAPLMFLPLIFWKRKGYIWLGAWTVAAFAVPTIITAVYNLWPSNLIVNDPAASLEYSHRMYLMPWCRAAPYLVGLWAGYLIHRARQNPHVWKLNSWQVWLGWGASTGVGLAVVLGLYKYNQVSIDVPKMSVAEAALYGGLHRGVWGVVIAWVILACHWGYGGPVDWFLSHPCWQPLSRLTYCVYLTSLPIQFAVQYSSHRSTYFTHLLKLEETCGIMLIVLCVSILLTLATEAPILHLEKLLLRPSDVPNVERHEATCSLVPPQAHSPQSSTTTLNTGLDQEVESETHTSLDIPDGSSVKVDSIGSVVQNHEPTDTTIQPLDVAPTVRQELLGSDTVISQGVTNPGYEET